jgi:thioredoxin reductase
VIVHEQVSNRASTEERIVYDVAVAGAGPAGAQAAVSAAHQMRHVLVLDASPISQRKGRAHWSKSVEIQDAPFVGGITGPKLVQALRDWMASQPIRTVTIGGKERTVGIDYRPGVLLRVRRVPPEPGERAPAGHLFELQVSTKSLRHKATADPTSILEHSSFFYARTFVVATGFEDNWPAIEADPSAPRLYQRHRILFRYAGNRKGWHVCIRCDGHLHVDEPIAILATGDFAWGTARGAQDFTDKITILTNGRPHGLSPERLAILEAQGIPIVTDRIVAHIGKGTDLMGLRLADGRELYFDGFILDEGLTPNTEYLDAEDGWSLQTDEEGLLIVDEDGQVLDPEGDPIPGLFAAGDIIADQRNLIATAFALGQNAGLSASDLMREW